MRWQHKDSSSQHRSAVPYRHRTGGPLRSRASPWPTRFRRTETRAPEMWAYCDTSALAKRYVQEPGRPALMRLLSGRRVVSSSVTPIELHSAFARRVRDGHLATVSLPRLWERVSEERQRWTLVTLSPEIVSHAQELVEHDPLRTLDAIH